MKKLLKALSMVICVTIIGVMVISLTACGLKNVISYEKYGSFSKIAELLDSNIECANNLDEVGNEELNNTNIQNVAYSKIYNASSIIMETENEETIDENVDEDNNKITKSENLLTIFAYVEYIKGKQTFID